MTLLDIYDAQATRLGKTTYCSTAYSEDEYVMTVSLCVFDSAGNLLIRKSSPKSSVWDLSVNTYVHHGETCPKALRRETRKIPYIGSVLQARFDIQIRTPGVIKTYYAIRKRDIQVPRDIPGISTEDVRFASYQDVLELMSCGKFTAYEPSMLKHLFAFGSHQCPAI